MDRRFEQLLEAAPDAMVEVNAEGKILLVNAGCETLFGYSRTELLGMKVDDLVPVALRGRHEGHRANYARTPVTRPMGQAMKLRALRKDGTEVPVQISISQLQVNGEQHTVAAIRDVSDADAMAEALRHSAEQTRQLFDLSPVACCVYDAETLQFLDVNAQAMATYGYSREEFLEMTVKDLRNQDEETEIEAEYRLRSHVRKNGEKVEIEMQRHAMQYRGRSAQLVVLRDITERRRFEETLEEARATAEGRERTARSERRTPQ